MNTKTAPLKPLRIIGFGASTMRGWREGLAKEKPFRAVLENGLRAHGISATVIDAGIGGNTTIDAMRRFDRDVLEQEPDIVLIGIGINDSWVADDHTEARVPLCAYRANLQYWVDILKSRQTPIVFITLQPMTAKFDAGRNLQIEKYVSVQRDIASQENIPIVDVHRKLTDMATRGFDLDSLYMDGQHFNVEGNKLVGEMLLDLERQSGLFSNLDTSKS